MSVDPAHLHSLYQLFASIESEQEAERLLTDLLTPKEIESFAERWQLVQALHKGLPQREIAQKLGISISKITRGSRILQYGNGGIEHFLKKLHTK